MKVVCFSSPITEDEVIEIIKNLAANKSPGHDHIPILIIKKQANELSITLTYIFNLSLKNGIVPDQLKIARVVPIHKKERKDTLNNYRQISVLPGFSKILERLIFNRCIRKKISGQSHNAQCFYVILDQPPIMHNAFMMTSINSANFLHTAEYMFTQAIF